MCLALACWLLVSQSLFDLTIVFHGKIPRDDKLPDRPRYHLAMAAARAGGEGGNSSGSVGVGVANEITLRSPSVVNWTMRTDERDTHPLASGCPRQFRWTVDRECPTLATLDAHQDAPDRGGNEASKPTTTIIVVGVGILLSPKRRLTRQKDADSWTTATFYTKNLLPRRDGRHAKC